MRSLAAALASAALLISVFPRFDLAWLAPVALAPLLAAASGETRLARRFLLGEASGILYWFGVCYWIRDVLAVYGGMNGARAWGVFLLFCIGKAVHMGVFTALAGPLMRRWYAVPAIAALWVGLERTHGPLGFAWLALGNAGIEMRAPLRLAPWLGVYGVSFVFVMLNVALALSVLRRPRRHLAWLLVLPALLLLPDLPPPERGSREAALVQPNIAMHQEWTEESMRRMQDRLARMSLQAALAPGASAPSLLIWPESPAPLYFETDERFRGLSQDLARLTRSHFLFGTVAYTPAGRPLNSAAMVGPSGAPLGRYDKIFLVPFGEFVPPAFGFVTRITQEAGDFTPGREIMVFRAGEQRPGAFICYESAFPHLVRQFAARGADVFLNLSNDGYFGHSAAREQHLLLARMRAVENRRWLVRATNDGITAVVDPAGRVAERWKPYVEHAGRVRYSTVRERTAYSRFGDWFAWLCLLAVVGPAVAGVRLKRLPSAT